jgi:urea-proton symporter
VVSEIWLFVCLLVAVVYPVVDGRKVLWKAFTLFYQSLTEKKDVQSQEENDETGSEEAPEITPVQHSSGLLEKSA